MIYFQNLFTATNHTQSVFSLDKTKSNLTYHPMQFKKKKKKKGPLRAWKYNVLHCFLCSDCE